MSAERSGSLDGHPLSAQHARRVTTPSGVPLEEITLAALRRDALEAADLRASRQALGRQADVARSAEQPRLAECLDCGAELTDVPDELILDLYTALRPRRSSAVELEAWAERLEREFAARRTAEPMLEALDVYRLRGLLADGDCI